jgi:hypothetical protein
MEVVLGEKNKQPQPKNNVAMKVKDDVILPLKVFTRILQCFFLPQMI